MKLPLVVGAMDDEALQKLRRQYEAGGFVIIGPDGNISHVLQFSSQGHSISQLNAIFSQ
jgi:hypothetical protein